MKQENNPFADITAEQHPVVDQHPEEKDFFFFDDGEDAGSPTGADTTGEGTSIFDDPFQIPLESDPFATTGSIFEPAGADDPGQNTPFQDHGLPNFDDEIHVPQEPTLTGRNTSEGADAKGEPLLPEIAPAACMTFSCLSCSTPNDVDFVPELTENTTVTCVSCAARIHLMRESSAQRAAQKSREIYCVKCGHQLDHHVNCPACGLFCPDYFVAENPAAAKRKARQQRLAGARDIFDSLGAALTWKTTKKASHGYTPQRAAHGREGGGERIVKLLAGFALLAAVVAGGAFLYLQHKEEQAYVTTYVKAVYALKMGADSKLESLAKLTADWKVASDAGQAFVPRIDDKAEARSAKIRDKAGKLLQKLQKVPKKYEQAQARLGTMNSECLALYKLAENPPASLAQLTSAMEKSGKTYKQACQDLKASLPAKLSGELEDAKTRFRGLADF